MNKKNPIRFFCLIIIAILVLSTRESTSQVNADASEQPRLGLDNQPEFTRFPPVSSLSTTEEGQTIQDIRLPASKVVFQRYVTNNFEIFIADDDGSNLLRLTNGHEQDIQPRLNRGSTKVVFASNASGNYDINLIDTDGRNRRNLTNRRNDDTNPAWSPGGSKIAFQSNRDYNWEIYVMNADGTGQTRLTNNDGDDLMPTWSPDGNKIAWCTYRNGQYRIWVMNTDGSGLIQLSQQPYSENPAWSPDGTQIAYDADNDGDSWQEVWVMNTDGSNQHLVHDLNEANYDSLVRGWSPNSVFITYTSIHYVYHDQTWYWKSAHLMIFSTTGSPSFPINLLGTNLDWLPDWQTMDTILPISSVRPGQEISPGPFKVNWSGSDSGGAGLWNFDIQVRDGAEGTWTDWLVAADYTSAFYPGIGGHSYFFRSRARDRASNLEAWPPGADAVTTVESLPPVSEVTPLPAYLPLQITIDWPGTDPGGSGIMSYDVQFKDITVSGPWTDWLTGTILTRALFTGVSEHTYAFRARAIDNALNQGAWPAGEQGDTTTTLCTFCLEGKVTDNTGIPVSGAVITTNPPAFAGHSSDISGNYGAYVTTAGNSVSVIWSKSGYGNLPQTSLLSPGTGNVNAVLPPADNVIVNPGLEFSGDPAAPWMVGGAIPPTTSDIAHTGATAVMMGMLTEFADPVILSSGIHPQILVSADGTIDAIWTSSNDIYYARRVADGNWSTPMGISGNYPIDDHNPVMTVAADGSVYVLWTNYTNNVRSVYYAGSSPSGEWSAPLLISMGYSSNWYPKIALDSTGKLHVVWIALVNGVGKQILYSQRDIGGTWSAPTALYTDPVNLFVWIDVDVYNTVHLIFEVGIPSTMMYLSRTMNGVWSAPIKIDPRNTNEPYRGDSDLQVDDDGNIHFVWAKQTNTTIDIFYAKRDSNGVWSDPVNISNTPEAPRSPKIEVGVDGSIHLVWYESISQTVFHIVYAYKLDNGYWSLPEEVTPNIMTWANVQLVVDKQGKAQIAWVEHLLNNQDYPLMFSKRLPDGWMQPEQIGFTNQNYYGNLDIAIDDLGHPNILWTDQNGDVDYIGCKLLPSNSSSILSQTIILPSSITMPVLSFIYQLQDVTPQNGTHFTVQIIHDGDTITLFSTETNTSSWKHQWLDLTPWAGEEITVNFSLDLAGNQIPAIAYLDDVTIGSTFPDVYVIAKNSLSALPGTVITLPLFYGNQGAFPAQDVILTTTLPEKITFVSADPAPSQVDGQVLTWNISSLEGRSGPFTIQITAIVAPDAELLSTLVGSVAIQTSSTELETANNTTPTYLFIGAKILMPMISRYAVFD
jgi:hypothetical protein